MPDEQTSVVQDQEPVEAVPGAAEESADTAISQQSSDQPETSVADEQTTEASAEQAGGEPAEAEPTQGEEQTEVNPDARAQRKARTKREFDRVLDKNRELKVEAEELRARLQSALLGAATPAKPEAAQGGEALDDNPNYWFNKWQTATDDNEKAIAVNRYNALTMQRFKTELMQEWESREQQRKSASMVASELAELHSISPLLKTDERGQVVFDQQSEMFRAAAAQAARVGDVLDTPVKVILYGNKAARLLNQIGSSSDKARAQQAQTKLQQVMAKTGLQPARPASAKPNRSSEAELKRLRTLADAGDMNAARRLQDVAASAYIRDLAAMTG